MTNAPTFDTLLAELSTARSHYEDMRMANGSFAHRAAALSQLHSLRSALAELRSV